MPSLHSLSLPLNIDLKKNKKYCFDGIFTYLFNNISPHFLHQVVVGAAGLSGVRVLRPAAMALASVEVLVSTPCSRFVSSKDLSKSRTYCNLFFKSFFF